MTVRGDRAAVKPARLLWMTTVLALAAVCGHTLPASDSLSSARLERLSRRYLGTPYRVDPLGEAQGPDADPIYTTRCVDCQTLVEQVMAEALAGSNEPAAVRPWLLRLRYRHARPTLESRFHYCIPDWLEHPWPVEDVTKAVAGKATRTLKRSLPWRKLLADRGGDPQLAPQAELSVEATYIPWASYAALAARIPDGSIACFISRRQDVVVGHMGLLFQRPKGVVLRHGSQLQKKVVDEPLDRWIRQTGRRRFLGLKLLQPSLDGLKRGQKAP